MSTRSGAVRIPLATLIVLIWLLIGVVVAFNQNYDRFDSWSQFLTFLLAVVLWPIPATGGDVAIRL
jgi:putative effector of murein hydrolase